MTENKIPHPVAEFMPEEHQEIPDFPGWRPVGRVEPVLPTDKLVCIKPGSYLYEDRKHPEITAITAGAAFAVEGKTPLSVFMLNELNRSYYFYRSTKPVSIEWMNKAFCEPSPLP